MTPDGSVRRHTGRRFRWRSQSRKPGGSFIACETIERLKQRIDDRLAERLCCFTDFGVALLRTAVASSEP